MSSITPLSPSGLYKSLSPVYTMGVSAHEVEAPTTLPLEIVRVQALGHLNNLLRPRKHKASIEDHKEKSIIQAAQDNLLFVNSAIIPSVSEYFARTEGAVKLAGGRWSYWVEYTGKSPEGLSLIYHGLNPDKSAFNGGGELLTSDILDSLWKRGKKPVGLRAPRNIVDKLASLDRATIINAFIEGMIQ